MRDKKEMSDNKAAVNYCSPYIDGNLSKLIRMNLKFLYNFDSTFPNATLKELPICRIPKYKKGWNQSKSQEIKRISAAAQSFSTLHHVVYKVKMRICINFFFCGTNSHSLGTSQKIKKIRWKKIEFMVERWYGRYATESTYINSVMQGG